MKDRRVVITGLGVVSPIASGREAYWQALKEGKNGVGAITCFDASEFSVQVGAEVRDFDPTQWLPKKEAKRSDRVIQFAVAASDMAMEDAGLKAEDLDSNRFGVYIGSGQGGIETCFDSFQTMMTKGPKRVSPFFIPMMIGNMSAAYVAIRHQAKGPNMCVVTACATSIHSIGEAARTIERGDADVMLCGGTEAALRSICVAGFAAMKALSTRNDEPERASRPFDKDRDGFVIGEGAGVLVLETLESAKARGAHIYGEVVGYGSTCDASHITAPDPEGKGATRAMKMAMDQASWSVDQVDLINAHGTSTPLNDKVESIAIRNLFGEATDRLMVNSTKSMIGHCLGAAGALETVAALQSVEEGIVHPTLNLDEKDPDCDVNVITETTEARVDRFLVNSFGFGGHNGVLAIERFND
ncbi:MULTISPECIES: beta-ketoacyl-ACP synthase II [Dethiosulfovibrio]|uniref:3-oxoacyl-[acyl-carrier-protein] synthase 2 n=2 Tax=Dethiosulfovibrio TaxID=47054 RepID=A0ABS9EMM4_9BACT|nr:MULTISPECIES: beta-ketoacyl-ACP synthase II [Dethiosulfovibrio]MCF4113499.1 beta-ketoacyl-ACP synthase II [Dethiosulfovibrio russensis]MCF4141969.1 beta-ketoacyl-ACP synthase II [Dethiosulfovibrio marinus]MCF4144124.1 beta-ketoacyl-ACP synthase II [Dethiosulfovibrio acidaminovorans]